eukprot:2082991-Prymnesium_polylepis.1
MGAATTLCGSPSRRPPSTTAATSSPRCAITHLPSPITHQHDRRIFISQVRHHRRPAAHTI